MNQTIKPAKIHPLCDPMDLNEAVAELRDGLSLKAAHDADKPHGHLGCLPGPPCCTIEISPEAAEVLLGEIGVEYPPLFPEGCGLPNCLRDHWCSRPRRVKGGPQ